MAFKSPAPLRNVEPQELPLQIVGGNLFGRYKKINDSQTWNMITSDNALVDYAGFQNVFPTPLVVNAVGRGIYSSVNGNIMIAVIGSGVYSINAALEATWVGFLETSIGDVYIAENNSNEIAITDNKFYYVYDYMLNTFQQGSQTPNASQFFMPANIPGYISFHLGRIIVADSSGQNWYLSGIEDAKQWRVTDIANVAYQGSMGLKPDHIQAAVPFPGAGNNLVVFGHTVMELWQYTANALFPYQRASNYNIDYGCLNPSSIAALDSYIVWLSANEQGGATVMLVNGAGAREKSISTDGIDFLLADITDPTNCTGFLFRQDGHLLYQFTFPSNNLSLIYDLNTELFFYASDENQNYHPARNVVFFQNDYYFVSLKDGNVYTFGTQFTNLQYSSTNIQQMYRTRICPPIRQSTQRMFICKSAGFTVENGQPNTQQQLFQSSFVETQDGDFIIITQDGLSNIITQPNWVTLTGDYTEAIDIATSRDGAESFGNSYRQYMNPTGDRPSRMIFQRLGQANDLTLKFKFIGFGRFVVFDGIAECYT